VERNIYKKLDASRCPSPSFVVDEDDLENNLKILDSVQKRTGAKILLAQKGFAMFYFYPLIRKYLKGVCSSGLNEARLGYEEFGGEVHTYSPAFREEEFKEIARISGHVVFNSFSQLEKFLPLLRKYNSAAEAGIRINPEQSETETAIYDPCRPLSRLGVTASNFREDLLEGITGLHFHTLCENNADSLERTLSAVEEKFGKYLSRIKWVNFGGGHHITRDDYDIDLLCRLITDFKNKYEVEVYLEPGEAVALNTGVLVSSVLDIVDNNGKVAILDVSAQTHMPDVIEMPYRPMILGSGEKDEKKHSYILGGTSCLAGDIIGEYSFDSPLKPGDRLVFTDMAHYSMVKTTTFNGVPLPAIAACSSKNGIYKIIKEFGYKDFKGRLS
jgi:carboxynorspermidine decarboxylase